MGKRKEKKRHASVSKAGKPEAAEGDVRRRKRKKHHRDPGESREGVREGRHGRTPAEAGLGNQVPATPVTPYVGAPGSAVPPVSREQRKSDYRLQATLYRQMAAHLDTAAGFVEADNLQMETEELLRAKSLATASTLFAP